MAKTLNDLYEHTIRDIYDSEKKLIQGMEKMVEAAQSPELKQALQQHIQESQQQVQRIEQVAQNNGFEPGGVTCHGTVGLIKEANDHLEDFGGSPAGDAAIIASAQKNEHYEIANYGTVAALARQLGKDEDADLLEQTLAEEKKTDELLTQIAESTANQKAEQGGSAYAG